MSSRALYLGRLLGNRAVQQHLEQAWHKSSQGGQRQQGLCVSMLRRACPPTHLPQVRGHLALAW